MGVCSPHPTNMTKKSNGTKGLATTSSVDGCSTMPETTFVWTCLHVVHSSFICRCSLSPVGVSGEMPEFSIKPPIGAALLIFFLGYLPKSIPQGDTSARQWGFEIRVFPLLGELPKVIKPHLPVSQLCHLQLDSIGMSLGLNIDVILQVGFTGGFSDLPWVDLPAIVQCQIRGQWRCQDCYLCLTRVSFGRSSIPLCVLCFKC